MLQQGRLGVPVAFHGCDVVRAAHRLSRVAKGIAD